MDSSDFFARLNSLRSDLKLSQLPQASALDPYLTHRTDKETNTYLNHTFTGSRDLQLEELQQTPQHGLEDQLREWVSFGKQKEEEIAMRYERNIEELKRQYEEVAVRYEQNTAERLRTIKAEQQREVEEINRGWEESKAALRETRRTLKEKEAAFTQIQAENQKLQQELQTAHNSLQSLQSSLKSLQETNQSDTVALRAQLSTASSQLRSTETDLLEVRKELSQSQSSELSLKATAKSLEEETRAKSQAIEQLRTELVEQSKEVAKLVQASKELADQRSNEREYMRKYREEVEGLEGLKWQLEREIAELAAKKQDGLNEYVEEYEERYQKAVKVADLWKSRADYTLAKFYTFARTLRLEVLTLRNEAVDWQETALTEFTRTVVQITRKYKYMLEDAQDQSIRMGRKGKKGKKSGAVSLL